MKINSLKKILCVIGACAFTNVICMAQEINDSTDTEKEITLQEDSELNNSSNEEPVKIKLAPRKTDVSEDKKNESPLAERTEKPAQENSIPESEAEVAEADADSYDNSSDASDDYVEPVGAKDGNVNTSQDEYVEPPKPVKEKKNSNKAKKSNPFKDFIFGKEKYVIFDSTELSTGTITWTIKPRIAEVMLNPKTGMAGIQTYFQSCFFNILFSEKDRAIISDSLDKYIADFDNHNLVKNQHLKTRRMYSTKGKCFEEWGTLKFMMEAFGPARFNVGYEFKKINGKTSPYFCIIIEKAKNINDKAGTNVAQESVEIELYFTKAQAKQFVRLLGRESINNQMALYYAAQNGSEDPDSTEKVNDNY